MKLNKILALTAVLTLAGAPSCSDDDSPQTPLPEVSAQNTDAAYNSLTFVWNEVADATQYGYELTDNDDKLIVRSVTDLTEVTVSGLKASTEYTMKVWAYASLGSGMTNSEPFSLKATTAPLRMLGAPTLEYNIVANRHILTWTSVTDAESYTYTLTDSDGQTVKNATITTRSAAFSGLDKGEYTFTVKATTTKAGYQTEGSPASYTFTVS